MWATSLSRARFGARVYYVPSGGFCIDVAGALGIARRGWVLDSNLEPVREVKLKWVPDPNPGLAGRALCRGHGIQRRRRPLVCRHRSVHYHDDAPRHAHGHEDREPRRVRRVHRRQTRQAPRLQLLGCHLHVRSRPFLRNAVDGRRFLPRRGQHCGADDSDAEEGRRVPVPVPGRNPDRLQAARWGRVVPGVSRPSICKRATRRASPRGRAWTTRWSGSTTSASSTVEAARSGSSQPTGPGGASQAPDRRGRFAGGRPLALDGAAR